MGWQFLRPGWQFVVAVILPVVLAGCMLAQQASQQAAPQNAAPRVWSPAYNAEQGPLPDTAGWKVVRQEKYVAVRLAPDADWSQYREAVAGEVRYTGSEIKLTPRQIAEITDYLAKRMAKELKGVKLSGAAGVSGTLRVNANITDAKVSNRMVNMATVFASTIPGDREPASVTVWLVDGKTGRPVARIDMTGGEADYEWFLGFRQTGQIRLVLRSQCRTLAWELSQMGPRLAAEKAKTAAK
jgi:hypothetical protein